MVEGHASYDSQCVIFRLGTEAFGIAINKVKEIIAYRETTKMPGADTLIEGVINLRGHIVPVFNLNRKFGLPESEKSHSTRIVVVEIKGNVVGMIVDGVSEVIVVPGEVIEKPAPVLSIRVDADYIEGIAKLSNRLILILDFEKVLYADISQAV